ncbi:UDP-N-acetylmuramate--L-alanine ligase [Heliobacillus mobilis]|uniref:UDP-N-acetylmuramate--L-alanine ligase n=1 Tax=Heliobacterium mobile TaxID=28064 RepID=A0A6I3SGB4_HELMO|nr:UDP-N-acetylmuramate--L-alanine ligase [Heliobacterium mobile]MTV47561.1 UDP-N-acetylmuramate--L-alanine ligase [Heliobacterium mobile]
MLAKGTWVHFIGIGGTGMSGLAKVMLEQGYKVSGSDLADTAVTRRLTAQGAMVYTGHQEENLDQGVKVVVVSTAVRENNPELCLAKKRGLVVLHRADLLAQLMNLKKGIAVAGAHGKTTTSAMIGLMLEQNDLDPAILVGGEIREIDGNAKWGKGEYMAAEADESDGSFLKLSPWMAVITNIEDDHLDHYESIDAIIKAFYSFTERVSKEGFLVLCNDDPRLREMARAKLGPTVVTYGVKEPADYRAENLSLTPEGSEADIYRGETLLGRLRLAVPGEHNISNALAAFVCADLIGLPAEGALAALARFNGAGRRFQLTGIVNDISIVDDYAHHPTEVKATLAAARQREPKRLIAIFQPHRFTRTRDQYQEFGKSFDEADLVIINEIYPAGEPAIPGVSARLIVDAFESHCGKKALYFAEREEIINFLLDKANPGDLAITMGAGNIWTVGTELLSRLKEKTILTNNF